MELAKQHIDVGLMVNDWDLASHFWGDVVGLEYTKFEKIGGGVRQHRYDAHGSVVKVNHSRTALAVEPTIHRRVRIADEAMYEPTLIHDPEGVEVELVPPGHDDVVGIEVVNATGDAREAERFWVVGCGAQEIGHRRYRLGDSIIQLVPVASLVRPTTRSAAGFRYLTVQVHDVDREYARLLELGFVGERPPVSLGTTARISFVRDPDGAYIEVSQRAEVTGAPIPPATS